VRRVFPLENLLGAEHQRGLGIANDRLQSRQCPVGAKGIGGINRHRHHPRIKAGENRRVVLQPRIHHQQHALVPQTAGRQRSGHGAGADEVIECVETADAIRS